MYNFQIMKKSILILSLVFISLISLSACQWSGNNSTDKKNNTPPVISVDPVPTVTENPLAEQNTIMKLSETILELIKTKDFEQLALYIHPVNGISFSPYSYVSNEDLKFSADDFLQITRNGQKYLWGYADGSGFELNLIFDEYYQRYIFDQDFTQATQKSFDQTIGSGNTFNNALEFFAGSHVVEYHFDGIDPQYEGMDWRSLRLVFTKYNDQWYLQAIIHDEWTI